MASKYQLTRDPLFYLMVVFFAVAATALPAISGAARFLPILQAFCLTAFAAMAIRSRHLGRAALLTAVWFVIQFGVMLLLTWLFLERMEGTLSDGFAQRGQITDWFYAGGPFPGSVQSGAWRHLWDLLGVTVGSLVSGGLIGFWTVARMVNLAAFQTGVLLTTLEGVALGPIVLLLWTGLAVAGSTGLTIVCAQPLLTRAWPRGDAMRQSRLFFLASALLLGIGLLAETLLAVLVDGSR